MSAENPDPSTVQNAVARWLPPWSWAVVVSALAWAVIFIAIPPGKQNFPLGDDWAFAHGAIWFAQDQGIHYCNWASMPQIGQWLWSWPFLKTIAPSLVALRVSVIVLSWLGLVSFYDLLRQNSVSPRLAGFAACVIAMNPLFFVSQGTYMTDVPALALALVALNGYSRAINSENLFWLIGATVTTTLAVATRQTMLAVPLSAGVMLWRFPRLRFKAVWLCSIILPVAAGLCVALWFSHRTDTKVMQLDVDGSDLPFRAFLSLHWCGLAVLPFLPMAMRGEYWRKNAAIFTGAFAMLVLASGFCYLFGESIPYGGLFPYSTGMLSPWGTYSSGLVAGDREILLTVPIRIAIGILGCIGGAHIATAMVQAIRSRAFPGLLPVFTGVQFLFVVAVPFMMDRYIEALFPGMILLAVTRFPFSGLGWRPGLAAIGLSGLISVALFHDWLSWNSARWELGRQAVSSRKILPNEIEGGFEWDGWHASDDPDRPRVAPESRQSQNNEPGLNLVLARYFFPGVKGKYALAFSPVENSVVVESNRYHQWLPPASRDFFLLQYTGK